MYAVVCVCVHHPPPLFPSPRPEIEIVGFNLPNNDHKLRRPRNICPLCAELERHKQSPLNRQINFTGCDTCIVYRRCPGETLVLFIQRGASAKPFNKQFPTGPGSLCVPVFQFPSLHPPRAREPLLFMYPKYAGNKV